MDDVKTYFAFDSFAINIAVNDEFSIGGRQGIGIVPIIKQAYSPTTKCVDLDKVFNGKYRLHETQCMQSVIISRI